MQELWSPSSLHGQSLVVVQGLWQRPFTQVVPGMQGRHLLVLGGDPGT
jgi:hypothetical protein